MSAPYPWLDESWAQLCRALANERLGHALLLWGRAGVGAQALATAFRERLLCERRPAATAHCGECRGCALLAAQTHPDFLAVVPAEEGKAIAVDQIRELSDYFALKSHFGGPKIAELAPADALNRAAANALLKILEEPPPGALIVLVAEHAERLPATVRSRCQRISLDRVPYAAALAWLQQTLPAARRAEASALLAAAAGAPLAAASRGEQARQALAIVQSEMVAVSTQPGRAYAAAAACEKLGLRPALDAVLHTLHELALSRSGQVLPAARRAVAADPRLIEATNPLHSAGIFAFQQVVLDVKAQALSGISLRDIDLLEVLWLEWAAAVRRRGDQRITSKA